jgi:trigger factor
MESAKTNVAELDGSRRRIDVEIAAPHVQAELDRAFSLVGRQARLPGFRPGKAPRRVLERMFGDDVRREVLGRLVEESFHHAVHEHRLDVVGQPEIDAGGLVAGQALQYTATVDVRPVIALTALPSLEAERPEVGVGDEDVERVIENLRESVAQLRPIEDRSVVEAGDVVTLNVTSRLDGGEPMTREGVLVEAGGGSFPLALERQLVGQQKGRRVSISVAYPDDYGNTALAGKSAEMDVEVLDLREKELPALDDDFARDHGHADSLAALRERLRADLERQQAERADAQVRESLLEQLIASTGFEVPASLVDRRCEAILMTLDLRLPEGGAGEQALAAFREQLRPRAEREVRADLLLDAVASREGFEVSDDDVTREIDVIAAQEGQARERVRSLYQERPEARDALRARLRRQRAMEHVLAGARIVPMHTGKEVAREK